MPAKIGGPCRAACISNRCTGSWGTTQRPQKARLKPTIVTVALSMSLLLPHTNKPRLQPVFDMSRRQWLDTDPILLWFILFEISFGCRIPNAPNVHNNTAQPRQAAWFVGTAEHASPGQSARGHRSRAEEEECRARRECCRMLQSWIVQRIAHNLCSTFTIALLYSRRSRDKKIREMQAARPVEHLKCT